MTEVHILALWKNDQPHDRFCVTYKGEMDAEEIATVRVCYQKMMSLLESDPEAKAHCIKQIEAFAQQFIQTPMGAQLRPTVDHIEIILMLAALERLDMIPSDEYNGVVGLGLDEITRSGDLLD